jgi:hypothetical protein
MNKTERHFFSKKMCPASYRLQRWKPAARSAAEGRPYS